MALVPWSGEHTYSTVSAVEGRGLPVGPVSVRVMQRAAGCPHQHQRS
jgi:hypothetical protein